MKRVFLSLAVFLTLGSPARAELPGEIVGMWRNDDEPRFAEMQFRRDGRFASLSRDNSILGVLPLQERSGTWSVQMRRLIIDVSNRQTKERTHRQFTLVEVTDRSLKLMAADGHTDSYRRLDSGPCPEPSLRSNVPVRADRLIGRWRGHYRTHEAEISIDQKGKAILHGSDLDSKATSTRAFTWRLMKDVFTLAPVEPEDCKLDGTITWTITEVNSDCLSFGDYSGMVYTMQRVK